VQRIASACRYARRDAFMSALAERVGERPSALALEQAIGLALERARAIDGRS
jgi:hypothetical protein